MKKRLLIPGMLFALLLCCLASCFGEEWTQEYMAESVQRDYHECTGYDTPEDGLRAYLEALNSNSIGGMLSTFTVQGNSFTVPTYLLQIGRDTNLSVFAGTLEILSIDDASAMAAPYDSEEYPDEMRVEMLKNGFDDYRDLVAVFTAAGGEYYQFMQSVRIGDKWYNHEYYNYRSGVYDLLFDVDNPRYEIGIKPTDNQRIREGQESFASLAATSVSVENTPVSGALTDLVAFSSPGLTTAYIYQDGDLIGEDVTINGTVNEGVLSRNKSSAVLLSSNNSLYFITDHKVEWVDDQIRQYHLAADGGAVVYTTKSPDQLKQFFPGQDPVVLADKYVANLAISPDGQTVAYAKDNALYICRNGTSAEIRRENIRDFLSVLAVSNNGSHVYCTARTNDEQYGFFAVNDGMLNRLGQDSLDINQVGNWRTECTPDATELLLEMKSRDGSEFTCLLSRDGGEFIQLPITDMLYPYSGTSRLFGRGTFYLPVRSVLNQYCLFPLKSSGCYTVGYLDGEGSLNLIEGLPNDDDNNLESHRFFPLSDGSLYVFNNSQLYYVPSPKSAAVLIAEDAGGFFYGADQSPAVYIGLHGSRELTVAQSGNVSTVIRRISGDLGVTSKALYYFTEDYDLHRRTLNGQEYVLFKGVSPNYIDSMPIEDFAGSF